MLLKEKEKNAVLSLRGASYQKHRRRGALSWEDTRSRKRWAMFGGPVIDQKCTGQPRKVSSTPVADRTGSYGLCSLATPTGLQRGLGIAPAQ